MKTEEQFKEILEKLTCDSQVNVESIGAKNVRMAVLRGAANPEIDALMAKGCMEEITIKRLERSEAWLLSAKLSGKTVQDFDPDWLLAIIELARKQLKEGERFFTRY
jgi:hypothetical protein